ncbi:phosphate ABC transporter substrate-binding protein PstS [Brevibacterium sp.]|uniref:phosphate ABC transporter substrate-binding protein PstS n=1 Tax=Brevibacterium sp. TaxID=1701 RepID=UPI0028120893|nr:phosphate ABC transporter substrate-binding protein PstS [Brevibacterium sp.]
MKLKHLAPSAALLAVGALTLSACGGASATGEDTSGGDSGLQGTITGIGASSQKAAMDAWTADFATANSGVTVNYSPDGSGAGREQFLGGNAQFAGSDAHLDDDEAESAKEVCGPEGAYEFPVYVSPIAVAFNLKGVDSLNLSPETIAKIFKGEITNWNDKAIKADNPDAQLPDLPITAVHRADDSGTTENFAEYLKEAAGDAWDAEVDGNFPKEYGGEAAQGTDGVVQTVSDTEGAIGYADASAVGSLGQAKVKVGDQFVELTPDAASKVVDASTKVEGRGKGDLAFDLARDTTESGAYPIVLVSYHVVCSTYKDQETVDLIKAWEKFVISEEGQQSAAKSAGSAPLSADLRSQIETVIDSITVAG